MRIRRVTTILSASIALLCAGGGLLLATQAAGSRLAGHFPSADSSSDAAQQLFASQVETLGANSYPDSFTGAVYTPAGVTDIYANPTTDSALVAAVAALNMVCV